MARRSNSLFLSLFIFKLILPNPSFTLLLKESKCPKVTPVENFSLTTLGEGIRYEIARYPIDIEGDNCISYDVEQRDGYAKIKLAGVPEDSPDFFTMVTKPANDSPGTLYHSIYYGSPKRKVILREYILATDNDNYYIGYDCNYDETSGTLYEHSWIVVKSKNLGDEVRYIINEYINSSAILDAKKYKWYDFSDDSSRYQEKTLAAIFPPQISFDNSICYVNQNLQDTKIIKKCK